MNSSLVLNLYFQITKIPRLNDTSSVKSLLTGEKKRSETQRHINIITKISWSILAFCDKTNCKILAALISLTILTLLLTILNKL